MSNTSTITEKEVAEDSEAVNGTVSIAAGEVESIHLLAELMKGFKQQYPNVHFELYAANANLISERIDRGLADIALFLEPVDIDKYDFIRLGVKERYAILLPAGDELAQNRAVAHDFGIATNIGSRRRTVHQTVEIGQPADFARFVFGFELSVDRNDVRGAPFGTHLLDLFIDHTVFATIEIVGRKNVGHLIERVVVKHQTAQDTLLAFYRLRRQAHGGHFRIMGTIRHHWCLRRQRHIRQHIFCVCGDQFIHCSSGNLVIKSSHTKPTIFNFLTSSPD